MFTQPSPKGRFTRRRLIQGGLLAAAGVAGGSLLYRTLWGRKPPAPGLTLLTDEERATVIALAEVYFPDTAGMPSVHDVDIGAGMDAYITGLPGQMGRLTQLLIRAFEWTSVAGTTHLTRFSRLPLDARTRVVDAWEQSSLYPRRMGFMTLKLSVSEAYLNDKRSREAIGWYRVCETIPKEEWL